MDNGKEQKFDLDELNLDTNDMSWDYSPSSDTHNMREMGNKAISSPQEAEALPQTEPHDVNPVMPPGYSYPEESPTDVTTETVNATIPPDSKAIKTTDKLDARAVKIIDEAVEKLNQDGDIASFYDAARGMMEANLENSYNRKLAA